MKIVLASDTYYPNINGAAFFTQRLAHKLAERGHDVFVIVPSETFQDTVKKVGNVTECRVRSIPIMTYPDFRFSPPPTVRPVVMKFLKQIRPDIIHVQNHFMIGRAVTAAARKLSIPIVGTNHFMPENLVHFLHLPKNLEEQIKRLAWRDCVNLYKKFEAVTTPTETAAALFKRRGFPGEILPISCGIDLQQFYARHRDMSLREKYNIPNDPMLLYVGRIEREKRIDVVIKALPHILKHVRVHFVVAGFGTMKPRLTRLAKKLGVSDHVTFTGYIPQKDLPGLYAEADIFVNAGVAELQSIVTMEAMASGLPILAANAMALPELVHEGQNGFLFADRDSEMLALRATQLLTDEALRTRMGRESLKLIRRHDSNVVITEFESLYERVIREYTKKQPSAKKRARSILPVTIGILATIALSGSFMLARHPESISELKNRSKQMLSSMLDSIETSSGYQTIHSKLQEWRDTIELEF